MNTDLIIGKTEAPARCKILVSIMEVSHSNIVLPGQPEQPQMDPRIKFLGQFLMPGPQGAVGIGVAGETREEVIEKMKVALPQVMRDFHFISIEQFELEV